MFPQEFNSLVPANSLLTFAIIAVLMGSGAVLWGGYLIGCELDRMKTLFASLGGFIVTYVLTLVLAPFSRDLFLNMKDPYLVGLMLVAIVTALCVLSLALGLRFLAEVEPKLALGLAMFATGAVIALAFVLFTINVMGNPLSGVATPYLLGGAFAYGILCYAGYYVGKQAYSGMGAVKSGWGGGGNTPTSMATIPSMDANPYTPPARPTESNKATLLASAKLQTAVRCWVFVSKGRGKEQRFDLIPGDNKVGRSSSCNVRIMDDPEVSREHCVIRGDGRNYELLDLASINRTFLNDEIVNAPRQLFDGDVIRVGETLLTFVKVK